MKDSTETVNRQDGQSSRVKSLVKGFLKLEFLREEKDNLSDMVRIPGVLGPSFIENTPVR